MILFILFISCFSIKHHIVSCEPASKNVFNICFLENKSPIQTTVSRGYILYARNNYFKDFIVNKTQIFKNSVEITTVTRNISNDQVSVSHSFKNILNSINFIELAVYTTLCFESTCSVHAKLVNKDGYYITQNNYELGLFFPKESDQPNISTLWVGQQKDIADNIFEEALKPEYSGYIGITYSWQQIYLEPYETKTVTMLFLNSDDFPTDYKPQPTFPYSKSSTFTQKYSDTPQSLPQQVQTFTISDTFSSNQKFTESESFTKRQTFTKSDTSTNISSFTKSDTSTTAITMISSTPITESVTFSSNTVFIPVSYSPENVTFTSSNSSGSKSDSSKGDSKSVSMPMIAGIVAGVIVLVIVAVLAVFLIKKGKRGTKNRLVINDPETEPESFSEIDKGELDVGR